MTLTSNKLNLSRPTSNKRLDLSERKDLAKKNLGLSDPKLDLSNPKLDLSNTKQDLLESKLDPPETELLDIGPALDLFRPQT